MFRIGLLSTTESPLVRTTLLRARFRVLAYTSSYGTFQRAPVVNARESQSPGGGILCLSAQHCACGSSSSARNKRSIEDDHSHAVCPSHELSSRAERGKSVSEEEGLDISPVNVNVPPTSATAALVAQEAAPTDDQHQDDRDEWAGFWSLQGYDHVRMDNTDFCVGSHSKVAGHDPNCTASDRFQELWAATSRPTKIDLSYWDPVTGERAGTYPQAQQGQETDEFNFRATKYGRNVRDLTKFFMQQIYHHFSAQHALSDELARTLLKHPSVVGSPHINTKLEEALYYSWVLLADSATSVKRLVVLARHRERNHESPIALWVIMQILRSSNLDAESLAELLVFSRDNRHHYDWQGNRPMLLTVRLLRHARKSAPRAFEAIVNLFFDLLRDLPSNHVTMMNITHWCNRVLTLLAIPSSTAPFRSMHAHQTSQLELVSFMQEADPQIPLMREGYRAVARVQLMHAKTREETEWARAKALTWPPWEERVQMRSFAKPEGYPGKQTRVVKVLDRMQESGYALYNHDLAVGILTGWDTDKSPTVQVRTTTASVSISKPWLPESGRTALDDTALIWSARVQATRTVREAWMCFCSYEAETQGKPRSAKVYHSMFKKLLVRTVSYSADGPSPGDGREVYPDPELARDRVYIPEEIPSIPDLFSRMTAQGLRPSARLLADLLNHESKLAQVSHYVSHADMEDGKRALLSSPTTCTALTMAEVLNTLPTSLTQAYIGFLTRPLLKDSRKGPAPSFDGQPGAVFFRSVLERMKLRELTIWNEYLYSLTWHLGQTHGRNARHHRELLPVLWRLVVESISLMCRAVPLDFRAFTYIATIAFRCETSPFFSQAQLPAEAPSTVAGRLFQQAARPSTSSLETSWRNFCAIQLDASMMHSIPDGDAIESMVWILGSTLASDMVGSILSLLQWVRLHQELIAAEGYRITKHNLAAFRLFLEGSWADEEARPKLIEGSHIANATQRQEILSIIGQLEAWPDEQYMEQYRLIQKGDIRKIGTKFKSRCEHELDLKEELEVEHTSS